MAREWQEIVNVNMMFAILSCGVRLHLFEEVAETQYNMGASLVDMW